MNPEELLSGKEPTIRLNGVNITRGWARRYPWKFAALVKQAEEALVQNRILVAKRKQKTG